MLHLADPFQALTFISSKSSHTCLIRLDCSALGGRGAIISSVIKQASDHSGLDGARSRVKDGERGGGAEIAVNISQIQIMLAAVNGNENSSAGLKQNTAMMVRHSPLTKKGRSINKWRCKTWIFNE